jgi:hypothetical protein
MIVRSMKLEDYSIMKKLKNKNIIEIKIHFKSCNFTIINNPVYVYRNTQLRNKSKKSFKNMLKNFLNWILIRHN